MKNQERWIPTKYVVRRGRLAGSRDERELAVASRLTTDTLARYFETHLPRFCRGRLADLGCGKAPLFGVYRSHVSETVCVDWDGTLHGEDFLDVACNLNEPLPFEDARFDTVILSDVLEHLPDPAHLWGEAFRLLAPGGRLIASVPFLYGIHEAPNDYFRFTEFALRRFAARAGFEVVLLEAYGGAPEVLGDLLAKLLVRVPGLGSPLAAALQGIAAFCLRGGPGRRLSLRTRETTPLGYFMVAQKAAGPVQPLI